MANLSKERRDRMILKLEELKSQHQDDVSIAALNEIENALREKKYGLVWEEHSEAVDEMLKENIPVLVSDDSRRLCMAPNRPWNYVIEGDNLQALYLLEKTHRGRVDCIYIDPPYNSGATTWKYNNKFIAPDDAYAHSLWLSMMKSRLLVAKRILNPKESILIVTIDEKEYLHLGCLLEEIFPTANIQMICSVINGSGSSRKAMFSRTDEYIFYVFIGTAHVNRGKEDMLHEKDSGPNPWHALMRGGATGLRTARPNLFYPIFFKTENGAFFGVGDAPAIDVNREDIAVPEGCFAVFPINKANEEVTWGVEPDTFRYDISKGYVSFGKWKRGSKNRSIKYLQKGTIEALESGRIEVKGYDEDGNMVLGNSDKPVTPMTTWVKTSHNATANGTNLLSKILVNRKFPYPKSLYAVKDAIRFAVADKPNAIVVDFFAGSGTTMHAVNLLNAEDGGNRVCIMVTNNEISEEEERKFAVENYGKESVVVWDKKPSEKNSTYRINYESKEYLAYKDYYGIAKYITWPRTVCAISGNNINGVPLKDKYIESGIPMREGFEANAKYFMCGWTPRRPEEYLLSNALCLHVKELIELQTAQEVDGVKNVIILSKSDYKTIFEDREKAEKVERVWVNENLVFNAAEMKVLKEKRFRYIPREYFSQELKEVGEYV